MALLLPFIFVLILNGSLQDCIIDNRTPENAFEQDLQKMLADKRFKTPSLLNSSNFEVRISFTMKSFSLDTNEQIFSVFSWIFLFWHHDKLKWNPDDYGGITETIITTSETWVPSIKLINGLADEDYDHTSYALCRVKSDGEVNCIPRFDDRAICNTVLTNWPYDSQTCSLEFSGSCKGQKNKIRLIFGERAITMFDAEYGSEWDIMDYKQEEDQNADIQLRMTFVLERHAEGLAALLVYPSTILSTLSVTSLFIDARSPIRLWLICFSLLNHFTFLSEIQWNIPNNSKQIPILVLYYRGSVILTVLLIFLTKVLETLCKRKGVPPNWMSSVCDCISKGRCSWIVWPRWILERGGDKYAESWTVFANLLNTICLFTSIITYVCLYLVFMPQPPPLNY